MTEQEKIRLSYMLKNGIMDLLFALFTLDDTDTKLSQSSLQQEDADAINAPLFTENNK